MTSKSNVWNIFSWIFGIAVFVNGVLNLFWGNDPGLGIAFLLISFVYFSTTNTFLKKKLGFSIHYLAKIVLGILIIWITLAVGAVAEGHYPAVFDRSGSPKEEESDHSNNGTKAEIEFDKSKWRTKDRRDYPYRNAMLEDLISNPKLRGLKRDGILELLGEPDRIDNNHLFYMIAQKRINIFPLHTKTLVIKLSEDSTITWIKIHE